MKGRRHYGAAQRDRLRRELAADERWREDFGPEWEHATRPAKPRLDEREIEARIAAAEQARAERERFWLEREAERYGLARPGRPISGMVA